MAEQVKNPGVGGYSVREGEGVEREDVFFFSLPSCVACFFFPCSFSLSSFFLLLTRNKDSLCLCALWKRK